MPNGVQRIRGLAGSGKTVVMALKAAYLHAQFPSWRIAFTFYSRSLYQQIKDLTRRFSFEHILDEPDWEKLQIMHCWGSMRDRFGIYTVLATELDHPIRDWLYAKNIYGQNGAFAGICRELLQVAKAKEKIEPIFDAVLIDEAQDLPQEFFELIAIFTKEPHRIVFAYDELQQLNAGTMPSIDILFGADDEGSPRLKLSGKGHAREDIVLPVCYRTPPWTLTVAHGLGFGVYREEGLLQHFDDANLWRDVGYKVISGDLLDGQAVTLIRDSNSYPPFFEQLIDPRDAVQFEVFPSDEKLLSWLAKSIKKNLSDDEIDPDDILIVLPDTYTSKFRAIAVTRALAQHGINAHNVGTTGSQDNMFSEGSVAISHIYRAKGNEAAMVYVIDGEYAGGHRRRESSEGLASRRNVLFTAITRARAWVRVAGVGADMESIASEFEEIQKRNFELNFCIPTKEERHQLRQVNRDYSAAQTSARREALRNIDSIEKALNRGEITLEDLPSAITQHFKELRKESEEP